MSIIASLATLSMMAASGAGQDPMGMLIEDIDNGHMADQIAVTTHVLNTLRDQGYTATEANTALNHSVLGASFNGANDCHLDMPNIAYVSCLAREALDTNAHTDRILPGPRSVNTQLGYEANKALIEHASGMGIAPR